jgi:hypothetical protein
LSIRFHAKSRYVEIVGIGAHVVLLSPGCGGQPERHPLIAMVIHARTVWCMSFAKDDMIGGRRAPDNLGAFSLATDPAFAPYSAVV